MKKFLSAITTAIILMTTLTGCTEGNLNEPGGTIMGDMATESPVTSANSTPASIKTNMDDMATESQVTSAISTAVSIKTNVTRWMVNLDTDRGKIPRDTFTIDIEGHVKDGKWVGSVSAPGFETLEGGNEEAVEMLKDDLADIYNFTSDISAVIWLSEGGVVGCAYSETGVSASQLKQMFSVEDFESGNYEWNGKIDGVTNEGNVIGTVPVLLAKPGN